MQPYAVLDKPIGKTPLEALRDWKASQGIPDDVPISYAGRLDPMASGKLLILIGDECRRQKQYTGLDKEYEIEVLLGVGSDTGDVLGIPSPAEDPPHASIKDIRKALRKERGVHVRPYPAFSSKTVNGKPLFLYALEGTLDSIEIPEHEERMYRIELLSAEAITPSDLSQRVHALLDLAPTSDEPSKTLGADFRIGAIRPAWSAVLERERAYQILRLRVACGSGTYMRALAGRIGKRLGTEALALSICRTRIGKIATFPFPLWTRSF